MLFFTTPAFSACETAAPDWTGRVWARTSQCDIKTGPVTEIQTNNRIWQIIGNVGRQIVPGMVWDKNSGWYRDERQDRVIWEGTAKQSSGPCYAGGKATTGWDFSNGLRICNKP
jgi:hypothetical protein